MRRSNPADPVCGECFSWANNNAEAGDWVVHGNVKGLEGPHAWIERGDRVFDWQTTMGTWDYHDPEYATEGWPIKEWYRVFQPRNKVAYEDLEAMINAIRARHHGPWEPEERRPYTPPRRQKKRTYPRKNPGYDPQHTVSAVVVVRKGNRILLLERGPTDPWMPGKWCFPGGAIDPGEGPFAGALRELREEAGLHATEADLKPLAAIPIGDTVVYAFETELPGKIRLADGEHSDFRWLTPTEIQSYPTIPLVKEIARAARTR